MRWHIRPGEADFILHSLIDGTLAAVPHIRKLDLSLAGTLFMIGARASLAENLDREVFSPIDGMVRKLQNLQSFRLYITDTIFKELTSSASLETDHPSPHNHVDEGIWRGIEHNELPAGKQLPGYLVISYSSSKFAPN
jgi:hypothetical protein